MPDKTFVILGPGDGGEDDIPRHWNRATWQWVEGNGLIPETLFTRTEIEGIPPVELPLGVHTVMDLKTGAQWTIRGEGGKNKI